MDIFHALTMLGGLCLFLFGMNFMGQALERRAGGKLRTLLDKMTGSVGAGFLTGLGITAIIQSSSATTVMVVGFVNSGLMTLRQAINVIMGANVGTTVTAWLLSLAGIDGGSVWLQLLKPTAFTPVLALIGIIFYMFCKDSRKKETGSILLGFATLMFGMDTMSAAVAGLKDVPGFAELFLAFTNPLLGVLVGAGVVFQQFYDNLLHLVACKAFRKVSFNFCNGNHKLRVTRLYAGRLGRHDMLDFFGCKYTLLARLFEFLRL